MPAPVDSQSEEYAESTSCSETGRRLEPIPAEMDAGRCWTDDWHYWQNAAEGWNPPCNLEESGPPGRRMDLAWTTFVHAMRHCPLHTHPTPCRWILYHVSAFSHHDGYEHGILAQRPSGSKRYFLSSPETSSH